LIKPKKPSLLADESTHKAYEKAQNEYISKMFEVVIRESKAKTISEIVIYLCETYHSDFKIKKKRGAKTKWSDYLKALIAVDLDIRKKHHKQTKNAIYELIEDDIWGKLFEKNDSRESSVALVKLMAKQGKKNAFTKFAQLVYEDSNSKKPKFVQNWNLEIKEQVDLATFRK